MSAASHGRRDLWLLGSLLALVLLLWLGYAWHREPRFAGSLLGTLIGMAGASLMLVPLAYCVVKRVPVLRRRGLQRWLQWHVYAGLLGAGLGLVHSGHRFDSWIGQLLIASALLSVLTGYVGRHLSTFVIEDLRERDAQLAALQATWDRSIGALRIAGQPAPLGVLPSLRSRPGTEVELDRLAGALADARYAVRSARRLRSALRRWLAAHIAVSVVFYGALAVHLWSAWTHGLRWWN